VSHALSDVQKVRRGDLYRELLGMPEVQRDRAWHDIVTLGESWFYLSTEWITNQSDCDETERFLNVNDPQFNPKS
jgi:hypothetical protein